MKKYIIIVSLFFAVSTVLSAQKKDASSLPLPLQKTDSLGQDIPGKFPTSERKIDTAKIQVPNTYAWKITPRLGERIFVPRDTVVLDFHQNMSVDGQGVAIGYLGNIGSPAQSKIFFERPETSRFVFLDAMRFWRKNPEDHYFLNTKSPYSNIKYQSGGGGASAENRFQGEMSINMGKKLNFGFDFDYVYSRGFYSNLSNKQISYDFYTSYIGDKYKMHAFVHNNNFVNVENGGISDSLYIINPNSDRVQATNFKGNSLDIPVRMAETWNKLRGRHIYITNRYDLGNDKEEYAINDSTMGLRKKADYVSLASVILTTHYTDQRRRIHSNDTTIMKSIYKNYEDINGAEAQSSRYSRPIDDYMSYYSFKNTFALAMNEGFRKWTKFGLTAFVEYDMRKYSLPVASNFPNFRERFSKNALIVGGVLSKEKGKYLRYRASAEKDFLNSDYRLEGEVSTKLKFMDKDFSVKAKAYVKNITPSFFIDHFSSKYWNWNESFSDIRRAYIGGEINFPELSFSKTKLSGGVETLKNYIYFNTLGLPQQESKDIQVLSLRLDQKLKAGIFHWDNQIVYQTSTNEDAIPLPTLSAYTNIYLATKVAKVLTLQLGVDAHFHTKYYVPGYEPLTMQFYNQRSYKIGNFPIATAYVNLHLKYTRFFIMMYNVANGVGNAESFSLYRYPVNPRILKLGISWRFNN